MGESWFKNLPGSQLHLKVELIWPRGKIYWVVSAPSQDAIMGTKSVWHPGRFWAFSKTIGGGNSKIFFGIFTPIPGGNDPNLTFAYFF